MKQAEMKMLIDDLAGQLRVCVSVLGLASDVLKDYQPRLVQLFETIIEEIETKLEKVKQVK